MATSIHGNVARHRSVALKGNPDAELCIRLGLPSLAHAWRHVGRQVASVSAISRGRDPDAGKPYKHFRRVGLRTRATLFGSTESFEEQKWEGIMQVASINFGGMALSAQSSVKSFRQNHPPGGAIVFVSSLASQLSPYYYLHVNHSSQIPYAMSKAATDSLMRAMVSYAREGLRAYSLNPAFYETEMVNRESVNRIGWNFGFEVALVNPIFNDVDAPFIQNVEGLMKLAKVVLAMFDNSTKYASGSSVVCDGDATWDGQPWYGEISSREHLHPGKQIVLAKMNDFKGDPYDLSTLPKAPKGQALTKIQRSSIASFEKFLRVGNVDGLRNHRLVL